MAADTYSLQALVLRKTKLGETDLIVTLLAQDGRQVRAVAKGARKPNSSFASRLEIFSEVDLLLVCGKSLDIVKEAKLLNAHIGVRKTWSMRSCGSHRRFAYATDPARFGIASPL